MAFAQKSKGGEGSLEDTSEGHPRPGQKGPKSWWGQCAWRGVRMGEPAGDETRKAGGWARSSTGFWAMVRTSDFLELKAEVNAVFWGACCLCFKVIYSGCSAGKRMKKGCNEKSRGQLEGCRSSPGARCSWWLGPGRCSGEVRWGQILDISWRQNQKDFLA